MFEKDGIVYESEEEYLSEKENPDKKKHSSCLTLIISFLIMSVIFLVVPMTLLGFMIKDEYHIFTKKRIAEMEDKFNITVTNDFELVRYERHSWQGTSYKLEIEGIDDYDDFMENNVNGEITGKIQDGIRYEYEENNTYKYYDTRNGEYVICFIYEYTKQGYDTEQYYNNTRYAFFYKEDDGTYSAVLTN